MGFNESSEMGWRSALAMGLTGIAGVSKVHGDEFEEVVLVGHYDNAVGNFDAASAGSITSQLIETRPQLRPGEVLEFIPGVIVTQHSGDGKANQYFLRGFNLDHGTDFATSIDSMPVNMRSHAHGQGYTDLNFLIPELVQRIDYRKGPYSAEDGDFASAGAADMWLMDRLPKGMVSATVGEHQYLRGLLANSLSAGSGELLFALEGAYNDGPWDLAEHFGKKNSLLRYSSGDTESGYSVTAMGYNARWRATDQIPVRAVEAGAMDRFGTVDDSDGGDTARYSLSFNLHRPWAGGAFDAATYTVRSRLSLFSNFTYFLDDPFNGDQFEQTERRNVYGFEAKQTWRGEWSGHDTVTKVGVQGRFDRVDPLGLYHTVRRQRLEVISLSDVKEDSLGIFAESSVQWNSGFRSVLGARFDAYRFDVNSNIAANSGTVNDHIVSPKLSLIFRTSPRSELFANYGEGFHSNDARGTTETVTPREGEPIDPVTPLVKTRGEELGARAEIIPGLQSSIALWHLRVGSELVFSGDAGDTEPSRPSQRYGVEFSNHYIARPWLLFDLDLALSHSRYTDDDPAGNYIPDAIEQVASFGVTVTGLRNWFGDFQLRYFGSRPLIEDNSMRSDSTLLAYLDVGYFVTPNTKLQVEVFNLFDRAASDIDYFYASRLPGEPDEGVEGLHSHPVEPRTFRLKLVQQF